MRFFLTDRGLHWLLVVAVVSAGGGVAATSFTYFFPFLQDAGIAGVLFGAIAFIIYVLLALLVLSNGIAGILNPFSATLIGFEVFLLTGPLLQPTWAPWLYGDNERLFRAWFAIGIGLVAFVVGYLINFKPPSLGRNVVSATAKPLLNERPWSRLSSLVPESNRLFVVGVILIVSRLAFFEYWAGSGGAGAQSFLAAGVFANSEIPTDTPFFWGWWFARLATAIGVVVLALFLTNGEPVSLGRRAIATSLIILAAYSALVEGNRGAFFTQVASVAIVALISARTAARQSRLPSRYLFIPGGMLAMMLVGILFQTQYRNLPVADGLTAFAQGQYDFSSQVLAERGGDMLIYLDQLLEDFGHTTQFVGGSSYVAPFVLLIPRLIWADKPAGVAVYLNNAGPTVIGELYANFGWVGIGVGMFAFGLVARWWYELYRRNVNSQLFRGLYSMSLPVFVYEIRGDFNSATSLFLYSTLFLLAVWPTLCRETKPRVMNIRTYVGVASGDQS